MFRVISPPGQPVPSYVADRIQELEAIKKEQYDSNMQGITALVLSGPDAGHYMMTGDKIWVKLGGEQTGSGSGSGCCCCCGGGSGSGSGGGTVDPTSILDDNSTSEVKTWSSERIQQEFNNLTLSIETIYGGSATLDFDNLMAAEEKGW